MRNLFYRIEQDIKEGRKKRACDRLRNLINQFPNDISLRKRLGNIYYDAGFLDEAGKFWVLSEPENSEMKNAVDIYRKSLSNSGNAILKDIVFRGDKSLLNDYAKNVITKLEEDSFKVTKHIPDFKPKAREKGAYPKKDSSSWIGVVVYVLIGIVILVLVLGIFKLFELINSLFF